MASACQNCNGMGTLEDGNTCPECVGGKKADRPLAEVTPPTVLPASNVGELPPSTATPDGTIPATVTDQGGFTPPEVERVPSTINVTAEPQPLGAPTSRGDVSLDDVPVSHGGTGGVAGTSEAAPAEAEAEDEEGYEVNTVEELQDELRDRALAVSGTKAELIARLEEDDNAPANA